MDGMLVELCGCRRALKAGSVTSDEPNSIAGERLTTHAVLFCDVPSTSPRKKPLAFSASAR